MRLSILLGCLVWSLTPAMSPAQDAAKALKLRWYGQSYFQLETLAGKKIVFDPHAIPEFGRPIVSADVILCSHLHNDHAQPELVEGYKTARTLFGLKEIKGRTPDWVRIDEKIGAIAIRTVGTYHDAENGMAKGKNTIFIVQVDGLTFCHLGDLGHELSEDQVKAVGKIDVLMMPIGGTYTINGDQAKKVAAALKPRLFIVPMHYGVPGYDDLNGPEEFLDGLKNVKRTPLSNELAIAPDAKADEPTVMLLSWKSSGLGQPKK